MGGSGIALVADILLPSIARGSKNTAKSAPQRLAMEPSPVVRRCKKLFIGG